MSVFVFVSVRKQDGHFGWRDPLCVRDDFPITEYSLGKQQGTLEDTDNGFCIGMPGLVL